MNCCKKHALEAEVRDLKSKNEQLEKMIDWLALEVLQYLKQSQPDAITTKESIISGVRFAVNQGLENKS